MTNFVTLIFLAIVVWLVWRVFNKNEPPQSIQPTPPRDDPQARHLNSTLQFAQDQLNTLRQQKLKQDKWQQTYAHAKTKQLDTLSGEEFEEFLAGLFRGQGYTVELTPITGDYGADLILNKDGQRICVQAKRYKGSVGVAAVQEALSGKSYFQCDAAWVVSTGTYTPNAQELAAKSGVKMIGRADIGNLMAQSAAKSRND